MNTKDYTLGQQFLSIKKNYPQFKTAIGRDSVTTVGNIKPTARSIDYTVKVIYKKHKGPKVSVLNPILEKNFKGEKIPHVYPGKKLCLYYPKFLEFNSRMLVADTIIPWTSLWLYHYENWHISGNWEGGGIHLDS